MSTGATNNSLNSDVMNKKNSGNNEQVAMLNGEDTDRPKRVSICLPNDENSHEAGSTLVPLVGPQTTSENNTDTRYGDALISGTNDFTGKSCFDA